jgi:hypothetical protein
MHATEKHLGRQAAGQQWPNDVVLRPHRKIPGTRRKGGGGGN